MARERDCRDCKPFEGEFVPEVTEIVGEITGLDCLLDVITVDNVRYVPEAEVEKLREELQGASECLGMIRSRLELFGEPMDATPPMNYDDAISALLFRRLKEAGVFPGHSATVRYEVFDGEGDDWFRRVPIEPAEAVRKKAT